MESSRQPIRDTAMTSFTATADFSTAPTQMPVNDGVVASPTVKRLSLFALLLCVFPSCHSKENASTTPPTTKVTQPAPPASTTAPQTRSISHATDPGRFVRTKPAPVVFNVTNPKSAQEHFNVAVNHDMKHQLDQAIEEYKKALALKPDWALAHFRLGTDYDKKRNRDAAIVEWKEA